MKRSILISCGIIMFGVSGCNFLGNSNNASTATTLKFEEIYSTNIDKLSQKIGSMQDSKTNEDYTSNMKIEADIETSENLQFGNINGNASLRIDSKYKYNTDKKGLNSLLENSGELNIQGSSKIKLSQQNNDQIVNSSIDLTILKDKAKVFFKLADLSLDSKDPSIMKIISNINKYKDEWYLLIDLNLIKNSFDQGNINQQYNIDYIKDILDFLKENQIMKVTKDYVEGEEEVFEFEIDKNNLKKILQYISNNYDQALDKEMIDNLVQNIYLKGKIKAKSNEDIDIYIDSFDIAGIININGNFNLNDGNLNFVSVNDGVRINLIFNVMEKINMDFQYFEGDYSIKDQIISIAKEKAHGAMNLILNINKGKDVDKFDGKIIFSDYKNKLTINFENTIKNENDLKIIAPEDIKEINQMDLMQIFMNPNLNLFGF